MLLEDKEDRVKISVIHSLAFIVTFIDDDDKYAQVYYIVYNSFKKVHHYNIELFGYESIRNENSNISYTSFFPSVVEKFRIASKMYFLLVRRTAFYGSARH